ncbi:hypothetical protein ACUXVY_13495 [Chromobacterium haemolyticum]|uniref:hypothetical protein n=1 Tax=Chromobacterium haemolyticum TaxID=394935 RepID=UPI00307DEEAE
MVANTVKDKLPAAVLATGAFDADDADVRNNLGLMGLLDVNSGDGRYRLTATLEPEVEGVDDVQAWILEMELVTLATGQVLRCKQAGVAYAGPTPGSHLRRLLANGQLQGYLQLAA